ncbi:MAG: hypothetical protein CHACPFDD_04093 [Phycisphaerae bacterium]|nr:hypothetical protein [Phycisphaerae bacterium]
MSSTPADSTARRVAEPDRMVDREARNPWYRWLLHFGVPAAGSLVFHVVVVTALGLTTWAVVSRDRENVGEFEAGITDSLADQMRDGFSWQQEQLETPETKLEDLDSLTSLTEIPDIDTSDLSPSETAGDESAGPFGGAGRPDILGIGSGAGEAGTGGFGGGLGGGRRVGGRIEGWGLGVEANKVAYVIDFSGSIIIAQDELVGELKRSVGNLKPSQSFNVHIFYERSNKLVTDSFRDGLQQATPDAKKQFFEWIATKTPKGSTEPLTAMKRAIANEPEAIFFLSDGYFDESVVDEIRKANKSIKARMMCLVFDEILLGDRNADLPPRTTDGARRLQRIAQENNGKMKIVTRKDMNRR